MIIMKLQPEYFYKIKAGTKTFEIRLNDEKRQAIKIGDNIIFKNEDNPLEGVIVKVVDLKHFNSFLEMARILSLESIGCENMNAEKVDRLYHKFYSKADEKTYGVLAIKIELVK